MNADADDLRTLELHDLNGQPQWRNHLVVARLRECLTDALGVETLNRSEAVVFRQADEQGAARPVGERAQRLGRGAWQSPGPRLHLDVGGFEPQSAQSIDQRVDTVVYSHDDFTSLSQLSHSLANSFTTLSR